MRLPAERLELSVKVLHPRLMGRIVCRCSREFQLVCAGKVDDETGILHELPLLRIVAARVAVGTVEVLG